MMTEPVESFATRAAHAGRAPLPESLSRPLTPPIYQSTVYAFARLDDLDTLTPGAQSYTYYRYGTPTHAALEAAICALEGAAAAVAAGSGPGVISAAVLALAAAGDTIVLDRHAYGGTYTLATAELARLGIEPLLVDATDVAAVEQALTRAPRPKALLIEALTNPTLRVADVPALCALGRRPGLPRPAGAPFASPPPPGPLARGARLARDRGPQYLGRR